MKRMVDGRQHLTTLTEVVKATVANVRPKGLGTATVHKYAGASRGTLTDTLEILDFAMRHSAEVFDKRPCVRAHTWKSRKLASGYVKHYLGSFGAIAVPAHTIRNYGKMVPSGPIAKDRCAILLFGAPTNVGG